MEEIIVNFDNNGNPIVSVKGVKGPSCKDLTKFLEKSFGTVISDSKTREYHEYITTKAKVRV